MTCDLPSGRRWMLSGRGDDPSPLPDNPPPYSDDHGGSRGEDDMVTETVTETTTETTTEPPADAPDVVVVDTGDDSGSNNDLEIGAALGALTVIVNSLVERVDNLAAQVESNQYMIDMAVDSAMRAESIAAETAETVEETATETAEDTAEETVEEMIEPQREHPIWRNPIRLRRGDRT